MPQDALLPKMRPGTAVDFLRDMMSGLCFSFARYGDSDWHSLLEINSTNADGHGHFDSLRQEKLKGLRNPEIRKGYGGQIRRLNGQEVHDWLIENSMEDLVFYQQDIFIYMLQDSLAHGTRFPLLDVLDNRNVVTVGPDYHRLLGVWMPVMEHVEIPGVNCYQEVDRIADEVLDGIEDGDVVLISAGMASTVLVDRLHGKFQGWILDLGSVWEPLLGRCTRTWHKQFIQDLQRNATQR